MVGNSAKNIVKEWKKIVKTGGKKGRIPEMWDGKTAERTGKVIAEYFDN